MASPIADVPLRTRDDQAEAVRRMVEPVVRRMSPGGARVDLGPRGTTFSPAAAHLEGFARPLWAIAALGAGGHEFAHWDRYREGIAHGADPAHPEYWGGYDAPDQRMVEQAAIAHALAEAPDQLWWPLAEQDREQVVAWLQLVNRVEPFGNNWQFFRVLVNQSLERLGVAGDDAAQARSLDAIHALALGRGWYVDGPLDSRDLYVASALHFYGLLYAATTDDEHATRFRARARAFAGEWAEWFDDRGDVVPFGRSLTYRFVAGAFWAALVRADEEALPWGTVRGLLGRHLRQWAGRSIWRSDGTLNVGYHYPQAAVGEEYISDASPYWAMKSFTAVGARADHPVWSAEEAAPDHTDRVVAQEPPGMVLVRTPGQVTALSARHSAGLFQQGPARYAKFAYSSRFGFSLAAGADLPHQLAPDSMLALSEGHGPWRVRTTTSAWALVDDDLLTCDWEPWPDVTIRTALWAAPPGHVRLHRIETARPLLSQEGGFAVGFDGAGAITPEPERVMVDGTALVRTADEATVARALDGRTPLVTAPAPDTNLVAPRTLLPVLSGELDPGARTLAGWFAAGPITADPTTRPVPAVPDRVRAALG